MIEFMHQRKYGEVFFRGATNPEEEAELKVLLSEIKTICNIVGEKGKTGFRIVREIALNGFPCVVLSLGTIVAIGDDELQIILDKASEKQLELSAQRT